MEHDPFSSPPDPRTLHPSSPSAGSGAPPDRRRSRRYAALGVTAGLLGGGAVGAMLGAPGLSAASSSGSRVPTLVQQDDVEPTDDSEAPVDGDGACDEGARGSWGGRSDRSGGAALGRAAFDGEVVAELLGIDVDTLREQLRSGQSVADIAEGQGVDIQVVIDALVAEASEHLDLAVENGRLTADEADERLAEMAERITERVEMIPGEAGRGGPFGPRSQD